MADLAATSKTFRQSEPPVKKISGYWLLAKMGKRIQRPGGLELTRSLLDELNIETSDRVVEFAPGLGHVGAFNAST
jgi:hypothetical protein